jgi:methanethiol S-methyltransferase
MGLNSILMALGFYLIYAGWRQIHEAQGRLVTDGIYARVRHPQYTGILLLTFAMILHWPTLPTVIMYPVIVWTYMRLARREEKVAEAAFGQSYRDYRQRVPAFIPRVSLHGDRSGEDRAASRRSGRCTGAKHPSPASSRD